MRALALLAMLALAGCEAAPGVVFADASIALPDDPLELPPGPGAEAVIANCAACHSPSTMLQQPRMTREKWLATITKMREVYKAPVDEAAIPAIADYLVAAQQAEAAREAAQP
jgi:mono/diheme cytochrome c family protein